MLKITQDIKNLKKENIIFLAETLSCLKKIEFLRLEKNILDKMKKIIREKKSSFFSFYIWNNLCEELCFFYYAKEDKKSLDVFLGEHITKTAEKICIISNNQKNNQVLLDISILWKYNFDRYISEKKKQEVKFFIEEKSEEKDLKQRHKTIKNICFVRDLVETPASDLSPEKFADLVKNTKFKNIKVKVLTPKDVEKKGMGLLWWVGKWSINKPYFVILEKIKDKKLPTKWMIGKWIIFDTGWLDIKPEEWMYPMRDDMGGAATVFGIMKELDEVDLSYNLVAWIPLAENAVSWESYRPSDILTSYIWKTVVVGNTDAEGRLVLWDAAWYLSKNYNLDTLISLATLTWACLFTLGLRYAGIMGDERRIIDTLLSSSKNNYDKYNELPFEDYYVEKVKSKEADLANRTKGIYTGPTMGAAFIYNFLTKNEKFVHIDMAGVISNTFEQYGIFPKWASGFWVESISQALKEI